jgi:hypothetical protein
MTLKPEPSKPSAPTGSEESAVARVRGDKLQAGLTGTRQPRANRRASLGGGQSHSRYLLAAFSLASHRTISDAHPASVPVWNRNFLVCRNWNFSYCSDTRGLGPCQQVSAILNCNREDPQRTLRLRRDLPPGTFDDGR